MINRNIFLLICLFILATYLGSCKHDPFPIPEEPDALGSYPPAIAKIIVKKCADGCHEPAFAKDNANLSLDTWEHMFDGANNGAVVVPYSPEYSSLMYFINTDSSRGPVALPTMPYNKNPPFNRDTLTTEEYNTIKEWITNGAPDRFGNVPFASNAANRQKVYMTMQGCHLVGVIDAQKKVVMRYIKVAGDVLDRSPHNIKVDPQGEYAYACFAVLGNTLVKINTSTDQIVGRIKLNLEGGTQGDAWNVLNISNDGKWIVASNTTNGQAAKIMKVSTIDPQLRIPIRENLRMPHGIASNASFDTFWVTSQFGNVVYKLSAAGKEELTVDGLDPKFTGDSSDQAPNPHEIIMSPDGSKLFVTCEKIDRVSVIDRYTGKFIKFIEVGVKPQEMAMSKTKPYLFVTCMLDANKYGGRNKGNVYVINYNTLQRIGMIEGKFAEPHGVAVDDRNGVVYVGSRNAGGDGPPPHHTNNCGKTNGMFQAFDLDTWEPISVKNEVMPDPYGADIRFK